MAFAFGLKSGAAAQPIAAFRSGYRATGPGLARACTPRYRQVKGLPIEKSAKKKIQHDLLLSICSTALTALSSTASSLRSVVSIVTQFSKPHN